MTTGLVTGSDAQGAPVVALENYVDGQSVQAVRAAQPAVPAWRATSQLQRARAIFALREKLVERREELASLVTLDMGKALDDVVRFYTHQGRHLTVALVRRSENGALA